MQFRPVRNQLLTLFAAALMWPVLLSGYSSAITVDVDDVLWPTVIGSGIGEAEIVTSTTRSNFNWYDFADIAPYQMAQSFQVTSGFDLNSLYIIYNNANFDVPLNMGLQIFSVADYAATSVPTIPDPLDMLLDTTFVAPDEGSDVTMRLYLDSPITLPANTGTEGYAIRFVDDAEQDFEWKRTGSSAGSTYAFGKAYESDLELEAGGRDFSLGLSSQALPVIPPDALSIQSGGWMDGTTWDTGTTPDANNLFNIVSPHTVTADTASFDGYGLVVQSGGTLDLATDAADFDNMEVQVGGLLTSTATGNFALGQSPTPPLNDLLLDGTASFTASGSGDELYVDVDLAGTGELNFESNGAGSNMWLSGANGFDGTIRFNGTGDEVKFTEAEGLDDATLEMNSTGANRVFYDPAVAADGGDFVFNQPGEIQHATTINSARLQGPDALTANADVTVDLTVAGPGNERRLLIAQGLSGTEDIIVNGTATDPTFGTLTRNEFEIGSTSDPTNLGEDDFSGTLTGNFYVDFEIRRSQPNALIVIEENATLETGHEAIASAHSLALGEVEINDGGTLEVGYEADGFRYAYQLTITDEGSRPGDLTLADGSFTRMQVNGTADGEFDSIVARGDVAVDGTLTLYVNPLSGILDGAIPVPNPVYAPTLGDTFDIIATVGSSPLGDYDGSGTVDEDDFTLWSNDFGSTINLAADGNEDGVVDGADYTIWQDQLGATGTTPGTISGMFDFLNVIDPSSVMSTAGLAFQINYPSANLVQLEVITAPGSGAGAHVPEPSSLTLACLSMAAALLINRRRRASSDL